MIPQDQGSDWELLNIKILRVLLSREEYLGSVLRYMWASDDKHEEIVFPIVKKKRTQLCKQSYMLIIENKIRYAIKTVFLTEKDICMYWAY